MTVYSTVVLNRRYFSLQAGDFPFVCPITLADIPTSQVLQMDSAWAVFMFTKKPHTLWYHLHKVKKYVGPVPQILIEHRCLVELKDKQRGGRKVSGMDILKTLPILVMFDSLGWVVGPYCLILLLLIIMYIHYIYMNYITSKILNMNCVIIKSLFWFKKTSKYWFLLCTAFLSLCFAF